MENNVPTLYILELDSFVVKSGKNFNYFMPFCLKNKKEIVYSCCHGSHEASKVSLRHSLRSVLK